MTLRWELDCRVRVWKQYTKHRSQVPHMVIPLGAFRKQHVVVVKEHE